MRTRMFSPFLLLVGLIVGLLAMWASASPLGATGDLVTGGWYACGIDATGDVGAVTYCIYCPKCDGSSPSTCANYAYGYCGSGPITVISCISMDL